MFHVRAFCAGSVSHSPVYRLLQHNHLCRTIRTADAHHLLFRDSRQFLQVRACGADLAEPVHLLMEAVRSPNMLKHQLRELESFNALLAGEPLRQKQFTPDPQSQRLCTTLRVLDGRLAGASYRDIAVALLGRDRVNDDWNASGNHLKNRIRRAAQRGLFLMEGGYRALLK